MRVHTNEPSIIQPVCGRRISHLLQQRPNPLQTFCLTLLPIHCDVGWCCRRGRRFGHLQQAPGPAKYAAVPTPAYAEPLSHASASTI